MTTYRPKLWTALGASVGAAALLAACSPAGDKEKAADAGKADPAPAAGEAGESAGGEGGAGEAGAAGAYSSIPSESKSALRLAHLKGFFLIAQEVQKTEGDDAAAALAGQGMLEVFDAAKDAFASTGVDEAALRAAATKGDAASLKAAIAAIDTARAKVGGSAKDVVKAMLDISAGLYGHVITDGAIDPVEYQHSLGAALAAKAEAERSDAGPEATSARSKIAAFVKLWPGTAAPEDETKVTPVGKVRAEASRIQLDLS